MLERSTLHDRLYGKPADVDAFLRIATPRLVNRMLMIVWEAYDALLEEVCSLIEDWDEPIDDLERSLTEELGDRIQQRLQADGGFLPFTFRHGPYEREGRKAAPAQPREYDLAFVFNADKRIMWPLEAKVVSNDSDTTKSLGDYVKTVHERFLACAYAPFSQSGAMLAYLKSGDAVSMLEHLGRRLAVELVTYKEFPERAHRTSSHLRRVPAEKQYPVEFCCHHLVLPLNPTAITSRSERKPLDRTGPDQDSTEHNS